MAYDSSVVRSQSAGGAYTVATLPSASTMVTQPSGTLAYTTDGGNYTWDGSAWQPVGNGGTRTPTIGMFVPSTNTIGFATAASWSVTIDANGNMFVGSTTNTFAAKVSAVSNSSSYRAGGFGTTYSGDVSNPALWVSKYDNNTTTSQVFVQFSVNNQGTTSGQINANGSNAAAFGSYSDARLKTNIVDLPSQLANIMALRPAEFDYIETEGGGHQVGFIAQEMQQVYPDVIGQREDGMLVITGWSKTEARLVKAIQELQHQIDELKALSK